MIYPTDMGLATDLEWLEAITKSSPSKRKRSIPFDDLYDSAYAVTGKDSRRRDRNAAAAKRRWEAVRKRYTWHLPLSSFDHFHVWGI